MPAQDSPSLGAGYTAPWYLGRCAALVATEKKGRTSVGHGKLEENGGRYEAGMSARALPVTRFLARMFPSLKNISTLRDTLDGDDDWEADVGPEALQYDPQWKEVASMLQLVVHAVRVGKPRVNGAERLVTSAKLETWILWLQGIVEEAPVAMCQLWDGKTERKWFI
ncbi:hypothetical protein B0H14DRAFT_2640310 [Mycena olivaceomarginata]|nr:hypothetical protein B0H14DRAFT_2640310 [Mycena olivaceomarginata]